MIFILVFFLILFGFWIFFLPIQLFLYYISILFSAPIQLWKIFSSKTLKRNHALEHATINLLEERYGIRNLSGLAVEDGFYISWPYDPMYVLDAVREGQYLLSKGHRELAIHKRCGTMVLGTNIVAVISFVIFLIIWGFNLFTLILPMFIGIFIGNPMGIFLQRYLTTDTNVKDAEILGIEPKYMPGSGLFKTPGVLVYTKMYE